MGDSVACRWAAATAQTHLAVNVVAPAGTQAQQGAAHALDGGVALQTAGSTPSQRGIIIAGRPQGCWALGPRRSRQTGRAQVQGLRSPP